MMTPAWSVRRLHAVTEAEIQGLADVQRHFKARRALVPSREQFHTGRRSLIPDNDSPELIAAACR
jgi:hypothetical protein